MTPTQLTNYLRSNRKRLGLSQDEVAFLLGVQDGAQVSRYEAFTRQPNLVTALAFEAVFHRPVSELFGGLYEENERKVAARAKALSYKTVYRKHTRQNLNKLQIFKRIAAPQIEETVRIS